jgi:hypothetical protein
MTRGRRLFVLTPSIIAMLRGKGKMRRCHACGRELGLGEAVVSVPRPCGRKWYCLKCAKRYGVWV